MIKRFIKRLRASNTTYSTASIEPWQADIMHRVSPYTMTSPARILSTIAAVDYVVHSGVKGAIVECGVWKGGNMMAAALTLQRFGALRPLYLFDTFSGMTAPEDIDKDFTGSSARTIYTRFRRKPKQPQWCEASIEEVSANLYSINYAADHIHLVKGPVESTLPHPDLSDIAVLRLDTDWYSSTLHELVHLYPLVEKKGVVIIDDYGHWQGARQAVDEYFEAENIRCLLHRIDYTGREFVKI